MNTKLHYIAIVVALLLGIISGGRIAIFVVAFAGGLAAGLFAAAFPINDDDDDDGFKSPEEQET